MLGSFSKEALEKFQEMQGLESDQDFSEGVFDFKVCQKPNGKHYGIPNDSKCVAPAKEVKERPNTGFFNTDAGKGIDYDTAKTQGEAKTKIKQKAEQEKKAKQLEAYYKTPEGKVVKAEKLAASLWRQLQAAEKAVDDYGAGPGRGQLARKARDLEQKWGSADDQAKFLRKNLKRAPSKGGSDRDAILEQLDEIRKQATSRIIDRGLATWDNENDPRRKQVVNRLKKEVRDSVGGSLINLSAADRNYIINELNNRIEGNL